MSTLALARSGEFALIGVIHLLALPGAPRGSRGFDAACARALEDAHTLVDGGVRMAVLENFGDAPFRKADVDPHVPAAMAAIAARIRSELGDNLELGINVLRNDARAALAVALSCRASFVRVNVHTGASHTDQGLIEGRAHDTLCYRRALGLESAVAIAADVWVKHGTPVGDATIEQAAAEAAGRGGADVLIVTGSGTGVATDLEQVRRVKRAVACPVWVGSGVTPDTASEVRRAADGAIVGTVLHRDARIDAPLDMERVRRLAGAFSG